MDYMATSSSSSEDISMSPYCVRQTSMIGRMRLCDFPIMPSLSGSITCLDDPDLQRNVQLTVLGANIQLYMPVSVRYVQGHLIVADAGGHAVLRMNIDTGNVFRMAGNGLPGYVGDGGIAVHGRLNHPADAVVHPVLPMLYIADAMNHRIRNVDCESGMISTFAGTDMGTDSFDRFAAVGIGFSSEVVGEAESVRLMEPFRLAVSPSGSFLMVLERGEIVTAQCVDEDECSDDDATGACDHLNAYVTSRLLRIDLETRQTLHVGGSRGMGDVNSKTLKDYMFSQPVDMCFGTDDNILYVLEYGESNDCVGHVNAIDLSLNICDRIFSCRSPTALCYDWDGGAAELVVSCIEADSNCISLMRLCRRNGGFIDLRTRTRTMLTCLNVILIVVASGRRKTMR